MKYTAILVTAGDFPGARIVMPIFIAALKQSVANLCGDVRVIEQEELRDALNHVTADETVIVCDASMPLLTEAECGTLIKSSMADQRVLFAETAYQGLVVRDAQDAAQALRVIRKRKNDALLASGVLLMDAEHTYIDPDVVVGGGTVIYPNCTITAGSVIGKDCVILPNCRIHATRIADGVTVESSVLLDCAVGEETTVGPFAYLRPGTAIGAHCRVGDFVEIKNSVVGDGTKVSHLTYVGDSDLGKRINLGCGVVFVNYDGKHKHRSQVADDAFIGCNVNLVSPVSVGEGAYVAAGSTVTENVPGGALAIARAKQCVKEDWVQKRKKEGKL